MSIETQIKDLKATIRETEWNIENISHPEEKYDKACREYMDRVIEDHHEILDCQARLAETEKLLTKPWYCYASSSNGRYHHPVAEKCHQLDAAIQHRKDGVDYLRERRDKRKEILDNYWSLAAEYERELATARENLDNLLKLKEKRDVKKKPKAETSRHIQKHTIEYWQGPACAYLNMCDLREIANNGAGGFTVAIGKDSFSVAKKHLKDILREFKGTNELSVMASPWGITFQWHTGEILFSKREKHGFVTYPEAFVSI